ncbi:LytR/AlgR family response regulator transcription factor [Priestia endophytica]|uniref:Two component transcriptional regulator, LytTR family n=1 Tax=Priestia endophytica DSM 13796 TaxID=1121089 RepID=A0A1I6BUY2_9BACI|nr:LytTR family DNA-binding domain-containing protein [Priestia endophytica]KYG30799.1 hypothetical protein AZF06_23725 [Priestia endophytica]MBG9811108.1 hypothetical protein [Priestia endophytica]SFQ84758.1 two component transcriptional regulator, LytTR family [Priestia endophytica DSM 13796]
MGNYNVLIVDDNVHCIEMLKHLLNNYSYIDKIHSCSDVREVVSFLRTKEINLVFLDIDMPYMNGLKLADIINKEFPHISFIFVTGYAEYALHGYELYPIDFLIKPVGPLRLEKSLLQFQRKYSPLTKMIPSRTQKPNRKITVRDKSSIHFININEISFIEKRGRKCIINIKGKKEIECSNTLNELERMLANYQFFRPHQSFLIPIEKIVEIKPDQYMRSYLIELEDVDAEIRVSKNKYSELKHVVSQNL